MSWSYQESKMSDTEMITCMRGEPAAVGGHDVKVGKAPEDVGSLRQGGPEVAPIEVCSFGVVWV